MIEPSLKEANTLDRFQFERLGYFCLDEDSRKDKIIFNRTVTLRDTWAKLQKKLPIMKVKATGRQHQGKIKKQRY
jgi:glutaminyl-tRNA synthetase